MFSISRVSKHQIRIQHPKLGTNLWYCRANLGDPDGLVIQGYLSTDSSGRIISFDEKSFNNEVFSQSKDRDNNGWRDCFHSYTEGTVFVLPNISNVTMRPIGPGDVYVDSRQSNFKVTGCVIPKLNHLCIQTSQSYSASYSWNDYSWMTETFEAHHGPYMSSVTRNIKASTNSGWYARRGVNDITGIVEPNWFDGFKLYGTGLNSCYVNVTKTIKCPQSCKTTTTRVPMYCQFIGPVVGNVAYLPSTYKTSSVSLEDPETVVSDLMKKLPMAQANSYMNVAELRKFKELVPPILNIIKRRNVKSLADLYLWWKYSYNTTLGDLESYYKVFQEIQAHHNDCKQQTISLTYNQDGGILRYNVLMDSFIEPIWNTYGFNINLANTWDALPFSFVLDWFVNIGSTLESIDNVSRIQNLNYSGVYRSFSRKAQHQVDNSFILSNLTQSVYVREKLQSLPIDVVSLHLGNPSAHLLDGSSLVVSKRKR